MGPAAKALADNANRASWNATSTKQYLLINSDGTTWKEMDGSTLVLSITPSVTSDAVLSANASIFASGSGVNTDVAIEVNGAVAAWKEAGGYSAAHPATVFVQTETLMNAGTTYTVALYWKTNVSQPTSVYSAAGAGPENGAFSPTALSALLTPHNEALVSAAQSPNTFQPTTNSTSWTPMDSQGSLTTTITTPGTSSDTYNALITANADTFAANGANQDVGICYAPSAQYGSYCNGTPATAYAYQENAGSSSYMPIAALVQYNIALTGGTSYTSGIVWKVNGSGTIYGAAGPGSGSFSPDTIIVQLTKAADNEVSGTTQATQETRSYASQDPGTAWENVPGVAALSFSSGTNWLTYLDANASLFANAAGFNTDLGLCIVTSQQSCDSGGTYIAGWTEAGGGAAWSPDATFLHVPFYMNAGNSYTAYLQWRTSIAMSSGSTIYAGLGNTPNVTSVNALQVPSSAPSAPTGVTASAGNGQATVSWTASASSPGSPQTGYAVTPYLGSTRLESFNLSNVTSFTVPNLANGETYTFAVSGVNGYGAGAAGVSSAVTPGLAGAPTGVTAGTVGNGSVALSWTAPGSSGASAITGYVVTPYIGGTAQTATTFWSTNTSATLSGLTNGSAYTFTVAAINVFGTGPQSSASASDTPAAQVPSAPSAVAASAGNAQATVTWVAPPSNGSSITSYTITPYIGGTAQSTTSCTAPCTSKAVTGLSNGTAYTFTVKAINGAGTGAESAHSWNTKPAHTPIIPTLSLAVAGGGGGLWPIGGTATYTATISANAGATTATFSDTLPPSLSGLGSQILVNGGACPTGTMCTAAGGSISVSGLAVPASGNVVVTYTATPTGPLNACATLVDSANITLTGGNSAGYTSIPIVACDGGLGGTPWSSASSQDLGEKSVAAVNPSDGNLTVTAADGIPMQLHGALTFALTRVYNSQDTELSGVPFPVGNGWILSFVQTGTEPGGIALLPASSMSFARVAPVTMVDATGARYTYSPSALGSVIDVGTLSSTGALSTLIPLNLPVGTGFNDRCVDASFTPPAGLHVAMWRYVETSNSNCSNLASASSNAVLGYVSIGIDRIRREYNASGQLLNVEDAAGNEVSYAYSSGKLSTVTEAGSNRAYSISYGSPVKVTEPSGEVIDYAQGTASLASVTSDSGGPETATFTYVYGGCTGASASQLCQVKDGNNNPTNFTYSASSAGPARVATIRDRNSNTTTFTYNAANVTADRGSERTNYASIDGSGRVAEVDQGSTSNSWLHQTFYFWDVNASGASCRQPEAAADNDLCAIIRRGLVAGAADRVTYYTYGDEGQMLSQREIDYPGDLWTTAGYTEEYFEAGGTVATYSDTVGAAGAVASTTQSGGRRDNKTVFDVITQSQSLTPRGNAAGSSYGNYMTSDKVDNNSTVSTNTTGGNGLCGNPSSPTANTGLLCETDAPKYDGTHVTQTNYQYNGDGSRSLMYSPNDNVQRQTYTAYTYYQNSDKDLSGTVSAGGWLKGVTDDTADCMLPLGGPCFVAYAYDAAGHVVRTWDRNAVNASGTPLSSSAWDSESSPPSTAYSETLYPGGQLGESSAIATPGLYAREAGTPLGEWSTKTYDGNGNVIGSKTARGNTVGNPVTTLQYPSCPAPPTENAYDTCRLYDKNDNLTSVMTPMEANTSNPETGGAQRSTIYAYDQFDNRVSTTDGNGVVTVDQYDSANRAAAHVFTLAAWGAGMNTPAGCRESTSGDTPIPAGRILCTTSTAYDGVDNAISTSDGNGNSSYALYDAAHRKIVAITPRSDGTFANLVAVTLYDADGNVTDSCPPREIAEGGVDSFSCSANATYGSHTTYDVLGRVASTYTYRVAGTPLTTSYTYDGDGNKLTVTNANGYQTVNTYLINDWLASTTVPRDSTHSYSTYYAYDPSGDLVWKMAPIDGTNTRNFEYTYDADHRVSDSITGASMRPPDTALYSQSAGTDVRTRNLYDADGNVVEQYTPNAFSGSGTLTNPDVDYAIGATYNQDDQQSAVYQPRYDTDTSQSPQLTDPTGNVTQSSECPTGRYGFGYPTTLGVCITSYLYDPVGNMAKVTWPTNNPSAFTTYVYTDNNLVFSQQGPSPNGGSQITTETYMYDGDGKQTYSADANNVAQWTLYNTDESVATSETSNSSGLGLRTTNFSYDANGEQTKSIDVLGNVTSSVYLPNGWKKSSSDGAGDVTSYSYDSVGNPVQVMSPSANASDANNPNGKPTYNTYSEDNLLVSSASPIGAHTSTVLQRAVCYYYDQSGRKTAQGNWVNTGGTYAISNPCPSTPGSNSFTFNNLADDRLNAESGRNGSTQLQFAYDAAGNQVWTADQTSNVITTTNYYADNLPRSANDGVGRYVNYAYDGAGSITERSSVPGSGITYTDTITYSPADQEALETSSVTSGPTSWSYDAGGRPTTMTYGNGDTLQYGYNASDGTLASETLWNGSPNSSTAESTFTQSLDGDFHVTQDSCTCLNSSGGNVGHTFNYAYDQAGRLVFIGTTGSNAYQSYDHDGNRLVHTDVSTGAVTTYTYNADDSLATTAKNNVTTPSVYDSYGGGTLVSDGCTNETLDTFDRTSQFSAVSNPPSSCTTPAPPTTTYTYNAAGAKVAQAASGFTTTINDDFLTGEATVEDASNGVVTFETAYETSAAATPISLVQGSTQEVLTDDPKGDLATSMTTNNQLQCQLQFDPYGVAVFTQSTSNLCETGSTADDLLYQNSRRDSSSGEYQLGSRTYDPTKNSFLQPDHFQLGSSSQDLSIGTDPLTRNGYAFVNGDPVNNFDPSGHKYTTGCEDDPSCVDASSTGSGDSLPCETCDVYPTSEGATAGSPAPLAQQQADQATAVSDDAAMAAYVDWRNERASFYARHAYDEIEHQFDGDPYDVGFFSSCHLESGGDVCPDSHGDYVLSGEDLVLDRLPLPNPVDLAIGAGSLIGFGICSASTGFIGTAACGAVAAAAGSAAQQYFDTGSVNPGQVGVSALAGGIPILGFGAASRYAVGTWPGFVTDVTAADTAVTAAEASPTIEVNGTRFIYGNRVLDRAAEETGPYHNFPSMFDETILSGDREVVSDGYIRYSVPGNIDVNGVYEIGTRPTALGDGELIIHRFFNPGG